MLSQRFYFSVFASAVCSAGLAEASRKNIQKTEKPRAEKCVYSLLFAPGEHCFDDTKLYFSVSHFSVIAFVQADLTLSS
jgi:hypothetical protein